MSSDNDFDDDEDAEILALVTQVQRQRQTQRAKEASPDASSELQQRLYRADGEIAILRAQLAQLQNSKNDEIVTLQLALAAEKRTATDSINALKHTVEKLEDEKQFLANEIKSASLAVKRRKTRAEPDPSPLSKVMVTPARTHNDAFLFHDHIWNHCIHGASRLLVLFLDHICLDFDVRAGLNVSANLPISRSIMEFLMDKKNLRLDDLLYEFCEAVCETIGGLLKKAILSVPFLLSLVHAAITFKPLAVTPRLLRYLIPHTVDILHQSTFLLDSSQDEEDFINYHDVPYHHLVLEKFVLIASSDILETLMCLASPHAFIHEAWTLVPADLVFKLLPENTERFRATAQINLVFNVVEMLMSSITANLFAFNDGATNDAIVRSLLKVFLIDIPIKDDYMFYGLNRFIGNNSDIVNLEAVVAPREPIHGKAIYASACPLVQLASKPSRANVAHHDRHLLHLRVRIVSLLEALVSIHQSTSILNTKEYMKSMVRIMGFEQNAIMKSPRSKLVHLRIDIISHFIRIFYYIVKESRNINTLLYPETLYEVFVILMRIAFGSDLLAVDAQHLLGEIRGQNVYTPVFNQWCEARSRQLHHVDTLEPSISKIESDFANGLEFPFELETIELAREILSICVSHEEADNLYLNMNHEVRDDMDLDIA